MSLKSLQFTQSTDEFFFTASNQIVNDLRDPPLTSFMKGQPQASKLGPAISLTAVLQPFLSEPENFV